MLGERPHQLHPPYRLAASGSFWMLLEFFVSISASASAPLHGRLLPDHARHGCQEQNESTSERSGRGERPHPLIVLAGAVLLNVIVCYLLARPVRGVGILMPGMIPPLVAATAALLLAPEHPTPVAFVAGTCGPLVGADLLHLQEVEKMDTGIVSIGGAGTFDGILLSGIVALYLA